MNLQICVAASLLWVCVPIYGQPHRYRAQEIPSSGGVKGVRAATALNSAGVVALWQPPAASGPGPRTVAFTWSPGELTALGTGDPSNQAVCHDLNDLGTVVGSVVAPGVGARAAVLSSGAPQLLSIFGREAQALAVNNNGAIVGRYTPSPGVWHAFRYSNERGTEDLGCLEGDGSVALDINDSGTVVGEGCDWYGNPLAFVRPPGGPMTDLNTVATCNCEGGFILGSAVKITPGGLVAVNDVSPGAGRGFILEAEAPYGMRQLIPVRRGDYQEAKVLGLNDGDWSGSPVAVGFTAWGIGAKPLEVTYVATRWSRSGGQLRGLDLNEQTVNPPHELLVSAVDVNAAGQIIVQGSQDGLYRLSPLCSADFNGDGSLNGEDYDEFNLAMSTGDAAADYNGDQLVDYVDFGDFWEAFQSGEGCP